MAGYDGPTVDIDVHHRPKRWSEIQPYLGARWRDYLPVRPPWGTSEAMAPNGSRRGDTFGEEGQFPGSDYQLTCEQLLDPTRCYRCILTHDIGEFPMLRNQYFMRDVCRAVNDWNVDTWLSQDDDRLHSVILVPHSLPDAVADEVKRLADHPKMSAILIAANPVGRPLGDPLYHPIFAAGAEYEKPISVHLGPGPAADVGGGPANPIVWVSHFALQAHHYISSMLVHGVFEKYPSTRVLIKEFGIAWLPWLMWRLDEQYDRLREDSPWIRKWPSEYIREHVKLSTQPVEDGARITDLADLLTMVDGIEDLLCYSSDYPHGTMDDLSYVARVFPKVWHEKIFLRNACDTYRWEVPAPLSAAS